ncbi:MAG TPA: hypothetical protein VNZ53_41500 [Steroidobacteraceae bacterium]|nr:hypothetical protein [Steroidobacteraceae bacterium]
MSKNSVSIGGSVSQSAVVAGDQNKVQLTREVPVGLPSEMATEEIMQALQTLRELLERLDATDRGKIVRALDDAQEEAQKPTPDKEEMAGAMERVVKYAKTAHGIGEVVVEIQRPLSIIAGWIGTTAPIAARLFGLVQ